MESIKLLLHLLDFIIFSSIRKKTILQFLTDAMPMIRKYCKNNRRLHIIRIT